MDITSNKIASVTGTNITDNLVSLDSKGLENGHTNSSVVIVFDDAFDNLGGNLGGSFVNTEPNDVEIVAPVLNVVVEFTNAINQNQLGPAPLNPFIFIDATRGRELHLKGYAPTALANSSYFNTIHDASVTLQGDFYRTSNNMPWVINVISDFDHPIEKEPINIGYNYFNTWASTGGNSKKDWGTKTNLAIGTPTNYLSDNKKGF